MLSSLLLFAILSTVPASAEDAAPAAARAPAAAAPKKPAARPAKKKTPHEKMKKEKKSAAAGSKYKTRALSEGTESAYRFDAHGEPIGSGRKASREKPKKTVVSEDKPVKPSCSSEEPCSDRSSDSDAL